MRLLSIVCLAVSTLFLPATAVSAAKEKKPAEELTPCQQFSKRLPTIKTAACERAGLRATGVDSALGFPILARRIPAKDANARNPRPIRVMLIGGIHGDELTASSIVFRWLEMMQFPNAQRFEWVVAPVVNPDGVLASKPSRVNANGVDLNRNFPTPDWQKEALRYWTHRTGSDPRRFPGRAPLSEPESRWVNEEMKRFQPDVIISVHAPYGVLDFDGKVKPPFRFGRLPLNKVGVYPGSLGNYGGMHKNVPVITIELPHAQTMPPEREIVRIWRDMLAWMKIHVKPVAEPAEMRAAASPASRNATSID
jgi:protein MpaA